MKLQLEVNIFSTKDSFRCESGESLPELEIAYCTFGQINAKADNIVWICHALTANADALDWWPGLVGKGFFFDPENYFIVCANIIGSCYGTTGPASINPSTQTTYGKDFPVITIRDMVKAHQILAKHLKIEQVALLIGGSMGGQQVLEWAIQEPNFPKRICVLATNARHSAWGIALNEAQRMAIEADPTYLDRTTGAGQAGLEAARAIAMISYRNYQTYNLTQTEDDQTKIDHFRASSYQRYQGLKLFRRFDVLAYWYLSKAMDTHHLGRGRGGIDKALAKIKAKALVISITSDVLFPVVEQETIAAGIPGSQLEIIDSFYGHDGFLIESEVITKVLEPFMRDMPAFNTKGRINGSPNIIALKKDTIPGSEEF